MEKKKFIPQHNSSQVLRSTEASQSILWLLAVVSDPPWLSVDWTPHSHAVFRFLMQLMTLNTQKSQCCNDVFSYSVDRVTMVTKSLTRKTSSSCEQSLFLFSFWSSERKGSSALIASRLWSRRSPNFWASQSCFLSSNWCFELEHSFIGKPMVITEPAVPGVRLSFCGND